MSKIEWISLPTLRLLDMDIAPRIVVYAKTPGKISV